ncbi:MAG: hypothetical protein ACI33N_02855 [Desulfovibrionaceae bacterium]
MTTIITKDSLRSSVEAATGGLVTVLYDGGGHPNYMRRIPKVNIEDLYPDLGLTGTHPAFIVNGVEKSELFIGVYPASVVDSYGVSLPGMDPAHDLNFDEAVSRCKAKGTGWHLMTNVEWALLGALGIKTGFQPRGNTYWGLHHEQKHETGTLAPGASELGAKNDDLHGRTLTGSGPVSWRHDNSSAGIADLVGNVWEWAGGFRLNAGELNIIKDNDAAAHDVDMGAESSAWKAILQNGTLATPGTADTLKYDAAGSNGTGAVKLNKTITSQYPTPDTTASASCSFKSMTAESGVTVPALLKLLSLYPVDTTNPVGSIWMRNSAERLALRGGGFNYAGGAGVFALNLGSGRTVRYRDVGFRPAFIL